ncbi:MAG: zinc-dependent metalloprotease [Candidatus Neomarinimicrobiota bacterium]|nr:zinc-dependent metalloprotease [Candidatus Neomarinimicrobiota bacterium]
MKKLFAIMIFSGMVMSESISNKTKDMKKLSGYFNMYWDNTSGKLWLEINDFDKEFLYVNSLTAGVGSNDIGLDRGQLGNERIVFFKRIGPKVLMIQPNYYYRAITKDKKEQKSVADGFAKSTLWGFEVAAEQSGRVLVDATDFFMQDAHGVINRLKSQKMGNYKVDASRSAIYMPGTMNFPENTNVETMLTYVGTDPGKYVRQVTPTASAITVRLHHSLVQLPDDNYTPRKHDPRAGFYPLAFQDYSVSLDESIYVRYIQRHRLEKKNPKAKRSKAKEPIIYYIDPGVPEPIRSAMIESGKWWNDAFSAAGYENAFQIKILPDGAHPMDVRYNMIHWVHRATRGWSYGGWVADPRTGEIIKGNVSLGSLRLRQDYLIATGLLAPYEDKSTTPTAMKELALARIKQLVAHEIGHTIGIQHNFLASSFDRASVMDYPHPTLKLNSSNEIEWMDAYATGIGEWDKISVAYGYQDFPNEVDENEALEEIIQKGIQRGITFITDQDSRATGSAHPASHLWDNGKDAVAELNNLIEIRKVALNSFGENNIRYGEPYSDLGDVLVPIYLLHRYQIEAAAKIIGGLNYSYALRGDGQLITEMLNPDFQLESLNTLVKTLHPEFLALDERLLKIIPPRASGRGKTRESFQSRTGVTFDGISLAETAAHMTSKMLFNPERSARLVEYHARNKEQPGLKKVLETILDNTLLAKAPKGLKGEIKRNIDFVVLDHLMNLAVNENSSPAVQSIAMYKIKELSNRLIRSNTKDFRVRAHNSMLKKRLDKFIDKPETFRPINIPTAPPGSPIGSALQCSDIN